MVRRLDSEKHAEWRKRLERFTRSGLTVARFCDGERASVASFYYWRKKLGQTGSGRRTRSRPGVCPSFVAECGVPWPRFEERRYFEPVSAWPCLSARYYGSRSPAMPTQTWAWRPTRLKCGPRSSPPPPKMVTPHGLVFSGRSPWLRRRRR
jgi:hypothetical protein